MKGIPLFLVCVAALFAPRAALVARSAASGVAPAAPQSAQDSARDEMRAGRSWHATRILRRMGADTASDPAVRLLLARAEAGWENWSEVVKLLDGGSHPAPSADPEALFLLGRALQEAGSGAAAMDAYRAFLSAAEPGDRRRPVVLARLARVALATGRTEEALEAISTAATVAPPTLAAWSAVEGAESRARAGDTATVRRLLALAREGGAADASWSVLPRARLAAGDSLGAERAYLAAREGAEGARRGEAAAEAGRLAFGRGDSDAARPLLLEGLADARGNARARAAASLLSFRDTDMALTLRMAAVLDGVNDRGPALRAFDRAARIARETHVPLPDSARLARARLMSAERSRQAEALEEFRAVRSSARDARIGALNLELWARLRERQGRAREVETLRKWLVDEYPSSSQAAEVLWGMGVDAEAAGRPDVALRHYGALRASAPDHARAGQASMRSGQILLGRGDRAGAAKVYEEYLGAFPDGRRWQEATYWAASARLQLGQKEEARALVARLRLGDPVSYYAVLGAELLGEPYVLAAPPGEARAPAPAWLRGGVAGIALLEDAGLRAGVEAEVKRLAARAREEPGGVLALAEALVERGRTVDGINLGWELRDAGAPWDRRLLGVVFPFPFREMIEREGAESGVDPLMMAALIRQESAFKPDIKSAAGAVGLMQVMPQTGAGLAGRLGPAGFRARHLEIPEVNLHLGAAFYRDVSRRYGGALPLVLAAYNAGPSRASRWRKYPEVADPPRFTERIPFDETRGYVKNVRRNLAVYGALYGKE